MQTAPFDYYRPDTLAEAVDLLASVEGARPLAGTLPTATLQNFYTPKSRFSRMKSVFRKRARPRVLSCGRPEAPRPVLRDQNEFPFSRVDIKSNYS